MKKTLALDLSTKSSGMATKVDGKLEYQCITSSSTSVPKRILIMRDAVLDMIKKYDIEIVVLEEVPEIANTHTQKMLHWLQGVVVTAIYEYNKDIEVKFIRPNSWRSRIGIKTGAGIKRETLKAADIQYVKDKYNIVVNDDIADAIGIYDAEESGVPEKLSAF